MLSLKSFSRSLVLLTAVPALACGGGAKPATMPASTTAHATSATATPASNGAYLPLPALLPTPLANDPMGVTVHRLSNGMTVYISTDRSTPSIEAWTAVRAGSGSETPQSTGLAHYLEHMLFKGTDRLGTKDFAKEKVHLDKIAELYAKLRETDDEAGQDAIRKQIDSETQAAAAYAIPNEFDKVRQQIGITGTNAFTSNDMTVYVGTVPTPKLAAWAKLEAERFINPQFRLFWPELEAVYEEKNIGLDNPGRRAYEALNRAIYPGHAYGYSSTIGEVDHLKRPAYQDMVEFFERYYVPENMAVLLVGDIDAQTALPVLEAHFGAIKRTGPGAASLPPRQPLTAAQTITVPVPSNPRVTVAWQMPAKTHPDRVALEVMDRIFLDGNTGMLAKLITNQGKAKDAGSNLNVLRDYGHFQVDAQLLDGQTHEAVQSAILEVVNKLKAGEFTEDDVKAATVAITLERARKVDDPRSRMSTLMDAFISNEAWPDVIGFADAAKRVTKADVVRVATQYLTDKYVTVNTVVQAYTPPKVPKPTITPVALTPSEPSDFAKAVIATPASGELEPEVLTAGRDYMQLVDKRGAYLRIPKPGSPVFTARWRFRVGSATLPAVCVALDALQQSGTRELTLEARERQFQHLGITASHNCTPDEITLSLTSLRENADAALKAYGTWLSDAALTEPAIANARKSTVTALNNARLNPQVIVGALRSYANFGKRSLFLRTPNQAAVEAMTVKAGTSALGQLLASSRVTSFVGDGEPARELLTLGKAGVTKEPAPWKLATPRSNQVIATQQAQAKTTAMITWARPGKRAQDEVMSLLAQEYLSGMSGLLFQEVREARGLAYGVFSYYAAGDRKQDDPSFVAGVMTQADKTNDALTLLLELMRRDIDDARFAAAQQSFAEQIKSDRTPLNDREYLVNDWLKHQHAKDPRPALRAAALKITKAEFQAWLRSIVNTPYQMIVVGPESVTKSDALGKFGKVTLVEAKQLFSY